MPEHVPAALLTKVDMGSKSVSRRAVLGGVLSAAALSPRPAGGDDAAAATVLRWRSGAADPTPDNISEGGFGNWRGEPSTYARIWADTSLEEMRNVWMMDAYEQARWAGTLDIACGGPRDGQTWRSAAAGGMDATWRATCRAVRSKWGELAEVHLSMAHELNGNWYPWSVAGSSLADFQKSWIRWHGIVHEELIEKGKRVRICLSMNADTSSDVTVQELSPDPELFDVLGCDFYSMWPDLRDQASWDSYRHAVGRGGSPRGIEAWFDYARSVGKPLSIPEWGVNPAARSDNPFFIRQMREVFAAHACRDSANAGAGELSGEAYFNDSANCRLWPTTTIPESGRQYRSLRWGQ